MLEWEDAGCRLAANGKHTCQTNILQNEFDWSNSGNKRVIHRFAICPRLFGQIFGDLGSASVSKNNPGQNCKSVDNYYSHILQFWSYI